MALLLLSLKNENVRDVVMRSTASLRLHDSNIAKFHTMFRNGHEFEFDSCWILIRLIRVLHFRLCRSILLTNFVEEGRMYDVNSAVKMLE